MGGSSDVQRGVAGVDAVPSAARARASGGDFASSFRKRASSPPAIAVIRSSNADMLAFGIAQRVLWYN
jgi:hypothetical protein